MSASVSCLCSRVSVVHHMCVGMEAFNVFCCESVVANLCPLTETSTCAKMSRERGRERASRHYAMMSSSLWSSDTKWLFEVMVQHAQQETKHYYVRACSENVRVRACSCVSLFVYVCTCVNIYVYYMCRKPAEEGDGGVSTSQCSTHLPGCWWCHSLWRLALLSLLFSGDKINVAIEKKEKSFFCISHFGHLCIWVCINVYINKVMFACIFRSAV